MGSTLAIVMGTVGGVLQLAGVIVTGLGAVKTWRQYRDEPLLDPARSWVDRRINMVINLFRRIVQLKRQVQVRDTGTATEGAYVTSVREPVAYQPLKRPVDVEELDLRIRQTRDDLNQFYSEFDTTAQSLRTSINQVRGDMHKQRTAQTEENRVVATGGIRLIIVGLAATAVGIVAQAVGLFFG